MKRSASRNQLDLFSEPKLQEWREVPQEIFLSWSDKNQLIYCANRDLDAAKMAESEWGDLEQAAWFRARALAYMKEATAE